MIDDGGSTLALIGAVIVISGGAVGLIALIRKFVIAFKDKRDSRKAYEAQLWRMGNTDDPFGPDDASNHDD